jgi:ATP-dependent Zn protease
MGTSTFSFSLKARILRRTINMAMVKRGDINPKTPTEERPQTRYRTDHTINRMLDRSRKKLKKLIKTNKNQVEKSQ